MQKGRVHKNTGGKIYLKSYFFSHFDNLQIYRYVLIIVMETDNYQENKQNNVDSTLNFHSCSEQISKIIMNLDVSFLKTVCGLIKVVEIVSDDLDFK